MQSFTARRARSVLMLASVFAMAGCARGTSETPAPAPVAVTVSRPVERLDRGVGPGEADLPNIASDEAGAGARPRARESGRVTARVSGRASRYSATVGNLIQSGDQGGGTLLTTVVSVDPMYAYFDVDELTVLRVRRLIREGKAKSARDTELPVQLSLANEDGFPHEGTVNFVDNQINPKTGTLRLRGVFANKD